MEFWASVYVISMDNCYYPVRQKYCQIIILITDIKTNISLQTLCCLFSSFEGFLLFFITVDTYKNF